MPFWESGRQALSRALSARRDLERTRFVAAISPFFLEDGKVPPVVENDLLSLLRETTAFERLDQIESASRGTGSDYNFHLSLVPPLLGGFDALAELESAS